jgi:3-oxoacyl-[acyl-carrier protein] reductase
MQNPVLILGASGEIGKHIAKKFSQNGQSLILHGNKNTPPKIRFISDSQTIESICADLTDEKSVQKLFNFISKGYSALSGVVFSVAQPFNNRLSHRTPWRVFDEQMQTQLKAAHLTLSAAYPMLKEHGKDNVARVIMISTEYSLGLPPVKIAPYVAAKSALNAYALSLAQEWLASNIRVHILAPGLLRSNLTSHIPELYIKELIKTMPEKKLTSAEDVAKFAAFLMTADADPLYGSIIPITRGRRVTH